MDISKFFAKKRDLSDQSNNGDEPKRLREKSLASSSSPDSPSDVFQESLKSPDWMKILLNCFKNLDKQVKKLYILAQPNNEKHIKGEKQLLDLTESINFMTKKFDDYEKDSAEKEKLIKDLREEVSSFKNEHKQLKSDVENQEQCSRRNCLLVHGIPEEQGESTDSIILNVINEHLEEELTEDDIERIHRVGKPKQNKRTRRPIITKFVQYNCRRRIFLIKKIKNTGISITESLTAKRMEMLNKAKEHVGFRNVSALDGRIYYLAEGSTKPQIFRN